ncbi:LytTR family DNA-binding domain-containing protein [Chryseolinea sp. T2]|uniref:LytR/AlgR family response regulator transcription factor n=1 Tax=Chryseolinea sp. T2 TaxID=3129255 RepID=UPI00307878B4
MKLTCVIVEDEPVARRGMEEYVDQTSYLEILASCENAAIASDILQGKSVDLLLLDIHMPRVTGIELLRSLRNPPLTILTTAYSEYALEGYSLDVVDYLVKPITYERFLRATGKAFEIHQLRQVAKQRSSDLVSAESGAPYFFIKCDNRYEKVLFSDVRYIEALQNYVVIHTSEKKLITYLTLTGIESQLPKDRFLKVHKSFLVSIGAIQAIDGSDLVVGNARIPISRSLKDEVVSRILGNTLFRR